MEEIEQGFAKIVRHESPVRLILDQQERNENQDGVQSAIVKDVGVDLPLIR